MYTADPFLLRNANRVVVAWIGNDDRGLELEVFGVFNSDCFLVIHVMPTALRK